MNAASCWRELRAVAKVALRLGHAFSRKPAKKSLRWRMRRRTMGRPLLDNCIVPGRLISLRGISPSKAPAFAILSSFLQELPKIADRAVPLASESYEFGGAVTLRQPTDARILTGCNQSVQQGAFSVKESLQVDGRQSEARGVWSFAGANLRIANAAQLIYNA